MTTITKEEIEYYANGEHDTDARRMARMLLAGMQQEPVAWLYSASFERGHVEGELTDAPGCDMPVYAAQPLTDAEREELQQHRAAIEKAQTALSGVEYGNRDAAYELLGTLKSIIIMDYSE